MYDVPRVVTANGLTLALWYATTHRTFHWGIESRAEATKRNEYVSQAFYERRDGQNYSIMAYTQGQRPSAKAPIWGIYRVEAHVGSLYRTNGKFTLLKGDMTRREALACIVDMVKDDSGHIHTYYTYEENIEWYNTGINTSLAAHCSGCGSSLYDESVYELINLGKIEIRPKDYFSLDALSTQK